MPALAENSYRISGHETFPCRYTWLPKAARALADDQRLFADEDRAMVNMGVGKNMTRSIRFWMQAAGVASAAARGAGHTLTEFGTALLGERGFDPFLEDIRTLWLIHWKLATDNATPLLAWDFLLNRRHEPEIVPSVVLWVLHKEALRQDAELSPVTIEQHFETFLHSYIPTRGRKGEVLEDNLDCPLIELELLVRVGERPTDKGRVEPIYVFRREEKPEISAELFTYCLNDFWNKRHPTEQTLSFREVAHGHGGPGQIFKLPEDDVRTRLEQLTRQANSGFSYAESANLQQIHRRENRAEMQLLKQIYRTGGVHG